MVLLLATLFLILWFLGFLTAHTFRGTLHILLMLALIAIMIDIFFGKRVAGK